MFQMISDKSTNKKHSHIRRGESQIKLLKAKRELPVLLAQGWIEKINIKISAKNLWLKFFLGE